MESATHSNECNCAIEKILIRGFSSRDFSEQNRIIETGRPTSKLSQLRVKTKACTRKFSFVQYSKTEWLCGCGTIGKLFCWPCLLFNDENNVWNKTGFSDLRNLHTTMKRHENAQSHIVSTIHLVTFGKTIVDFQLDNQKRLAILQHNEKVKENREILKRFIDLICHLGKRASFPWS